MNKSAKLTALLFLIFFSFSAEARAATTISNDIDGNTTWTLSASPYLVTESINFSANNPGATLTIKPGVIVEFEPNATLNIYGNLLANGTELKPINFKSTEINGDWQLNIFGSSNSELNFVTSESLQSTIASDNSVINIDSMVSESELTLSDSSSNINNLRLIKNKLYMSGGTAIVKRLNINGGVSKFYGTALNLSNATVNQTEDLPAIVIADSAANLEHIYIDNASHGIIASDVPNLNIRDAYIQNISSDGLNFSGGVANLKEIIIENANYGAGLLGDVIELKNLFINNTQSSSLQTKADETIITDSAFINGQNTGISMRGAAATLQNVTIKNFANAPAFLPDVENLQGNKLVITDNLFGVYNYGHSTIRQSIISNNSEAGVLNDGGFFDARNNYWGHAEGPTLDPTNPDSIQLGDGIVGDVLYDPWLAEYCEADCYSNIMFLPGIMSSRLYDNGEQLWEPGISTKDHEFETLYLDEDGNSINPNIYTKDVLDNELAYGKFIDDLEEIKSSGVINDYEAVAYDWRLSMEDILSNGVKDDNGNISYHDSTASPYIESELRRLAANSKSGKVTIIAHSNGGLVTKALINQLGGEASELIDKIILVAVPQLGTPQAIGSLLHGYDAGQPAILPFILSEERARDLAINMPMIYQLMPFADYYNSDGTAISTPYVTFEDGAATQAFIDRYEYAITPDELADFLNGAEGRLSANYDDLENPINANPTMLANALQMQQQINSSWQAPAGIKVYQIAGIGEDTLANINYYTLKECTERNAYNICVDYKDKLSYKPNTVIDGDGTVVTPSALAISNNNANVENWWVNLGDYNDTIINSIPGFGFLSTKHAKILEIDQLREFIFTNLISQTSITLPQYISSTEPELELKNRLIFTLHSPLALSAIDSNGNVISAEKIEIPGADYARYGEVQVLSMPSGSEFDLVLTGESTGSFTLEMEELIEGGVVATSTFSAIPSSTSTRAVISFTDEGLEESGKLQVDYNGDSIVDFTYTPIINETVLIPDLVTNTTNNPSSMVGGHVKPQPQVLGESTDLSPLIQLIIQLQVATQTLKSLEGEITPTQYIKINNQLLEITNKIEILLTDYNI